MNKKHHKSDEKLHYDDELERLQIELVKLQYHVRREGLRVVVLFEGRDAAGKGGLIKRISQRLNPRIVRVVALDKPTDHERSQWYFQRYVEQLPSAGQIVLFDRSWYNRAGVERVMGFCTSAEYTEFLRAVPEFERMLQNSGMLVVKYWLEVSAEEQADRFHDRSTDPLKRWKLSPMDVEARTRWFDYSRARDEMFAHTDVPHSPWYLIHSDDKKRARLNGIRHLLSLIPYEDELPPKVIIPPLGKDDQYMRPSGLTRQAVPNYYGPANEVEDGTHDG